MEGLSPSDPNPAGNLVFTLMVPRLLNWLSCKIPLISSLPIFETRPPRPFLSKSCLQSYCGHILVQILGLSWLIFVLVDLVWSFSSHFIGRVYFLKYFFCLNQISFYIWSQYYDTENQKPFTTMVYLPLFDIIPFTKLSRQQ